MKTMQFDNHRIFRGAMGGREVTVETGKMAGLANGSCLVRYGDTVVLVAATMSPKPRDGVDFFPLSVDYEEKLYAVGRIPGSWPRREGRPSEKAILTSRVIDRPIRPLFPKDMRNDVSIVCTVMSVERDNAPDIAAMLGTSIALAISDIPWNGPIAGVNVGLVDGEIVINPTLQQRERSDMELTVAGTRDKVVMIEAGANQVPDDTVYNAIMAAHEEIRNICSFIASIQAEIGKEKLSYPEVGVDSVLYERIHAFALDKIRYCMDTDNKLVRDERMQQLGAELEEFFGDEYPSVASQIGECIYKLQKYVVRRWLLDDHKRVDGRGMDDVRSLAAEVGILPRVHGSGMFTRGQTQVLTALTLGTMAEIQILDDISDDENKRFMHHYNFPSYSVGETKPSRGPGRREIGHGALAERALEPVIPSVEEFPYCIRLVSEVLSSNGSTSQGSVCGSTLALMDGGVPLKAPVAGISCGLVTEGDRWMTFTDIQGVEDFYGDMDFKVAGTKNGITAIQMDLKIDGLTPDIIRDALRRTREARIMILDDVMLPAIPEPRSDISPYAPKMMQMQIDVDKIREVIGKGGSVIQKICADTGAKVDIEDDGRIFISAVDKNAVDEAARIINSIVHEPEVGDRFFARVTRIIPIGAFVEFAPGKEGMVHISKLDTRRVEKVEDVVGVGDMIWVKYLGADDKGRINLSRKDAVNDINNEK